MLPALWHAAVSSLLSVGRGLWWEPPLILHQSLSWRKVPHLTQWSEIIKWELCSVWCTLPLSLAKNSCTCVNAAGEGHGVCLLMKGFFRSSVSGALKQEVCYFSPGFWRFWKTKHQLQHLLSTMAHWHYPGQNAAGAQRRMCLHQGIYQHCSELQQDGKARVQWCVRCAQTLGLSYTFF